MFLRPFRRMVAKVEMRQLFSVTAHRQDRVYITICHNKSFSDLLSIHFNATGCKQALTHIRQELREHITRCALLPLFYKQEVHRQVCYDDKRSGKDTKADDVRP